MSTAAEQAVADYRPPSGSLVPAGYLPLVRELALTARPCNAREGKANCRALLALVTSRLTQGLPVTCADLVDPDSISGHLTNLFPTIGGRMFNQHAHALGRVAQAHGQPAPPPADTHAPYDPGDIARLYEWADRIRDPQARHGVLAILAFGVGAGLGRTELIRLLGTDITVDPADRAVTVTVTGTGTGPRPTRTVPVSRAHEQLAAEIIAAAAAGSGWALRPAVPPAPGTDQAFRSVLHRARQDPRLPGLSPRRCRNTWIQTHLAGGTPLSDLLRTGGLTLDDLVFDLTFLQPLADDDRDRELVLPTA